MGRSLVPRDCRAEGLGCCELQLQKRGYGGIVEQGWGSWGAMRPGASYVPGARAGLAWASRGFLPGPLKNCWLVWRIIDLWISWAASPFHVAACKLS